MNTKKIKLRVYNDSPIDEVPTERMTVRRADGRWALANNDNAHPFKQFDKLPKALARLAYFENLEEEGRLVVLPCKVGDVVYRTCHKYVCKRGHKSLDGDTCRSIYKCVDCEGVEIVRWISETTFHLCMIDYIGDDLFITREEAEEALRRVKE